MSGKVLMRVSKESNVRCTICGNGMDLSLDIFDVKLGSTLVHVCDQCMDQLVVRSLNAISYTQGRTKQPIEIKKKNKRTRMAKG